jgi:hypothetical protein
MNHHFYATRLSRDVFVGITTIFPHLSALGGALLQAVLEYLETGLPTLLFTILSRCKAGNITYQEVFKQLLLLIDQKGPDPGVMRQLVKFAFAHVHARQSKDSNSLQIAKSGCQRMMHLSNSATLFRNTFDIPSVLDRMHDGADPWRSISVRSTTNNFVVYRQRTGSESKTLRVSKNVAIALDLLQKPQARLSVLGRFPIADALEDLIERGVLHCRSSGNRNEVSDNGGEDTSKLHSLAEPNMRKRSHTMKHVYSS